jgi:formylglycine-generating enzyme required for sulfatase activity
VVSFSAPSSIGWSVITGYTVKATSLSGEVMSAMGASSPITVEGLVNGGLYTFTVAATNSGGTGASAASVAVRLADPGMALIPGGTFTMGSVVASIAGADKSDGLGDATPHAVTLSAFYLAKTETTYADWVAVRTWARDAARGNGVYDFGATLGAGKGDTHPVQMLSWYDVVKWCNAKSERAGLTPVYYTNDAQTLVYRTGNVVVTAAQAKWGANGYRLPTEAEWEYAARGGVSGQRFPWGDTITHAQANYNSSASYAYDVSTTRGSHPTYATGGEPYTSPVGVFAENGYGLSDMVGNVWEWTWDWYGSYGSGAVSDPRGAASGSYRVIRGGGWFIEADLARSADRSGFGPTGLRSNGVGFRPARSSVP